MFACEYFRRTSLVTKTKINVRGLDCARYQQFYFVSVEFGQVAKLLS